MPKKKVPKNGFYFFMLHLQEQYAENGKCPPNMRDMVTIASPQWNTLTPEEKASYNAKAKSIKQHGKITFQGKLTSDGIPILQLQAEMEEREKEKNRMKMDVNELIQNLGSITNIAEAEFVIVSFNILCRTDDYTYIPNEVGIVKHCLGEGIKEKYHKFINPGPIPVGYTSDTKEHSEKTHAIPILATDFKEFDGNYNGIYEDIKRMVGVKDGETVYVFSSGQNMEQNLGCLEWIRERVSPKDEQQLFVADITYLLMALAEAVDHPYSSECLAEDVLNEHSYDYCAGTRCKFHEDLDSAHCALARAQRLSYILSDNLCSKYNIVPTDKHLPPRIATKIMLESWHPKGPIKPVINKVNVPLKPVKEHPITMLEYNSKSIFGEYDDSVVVPSQGLEVPASKSEPKERHPDIDDDEEFPTLSHSNTRQKLTSLREPRVAIGCSSVWSLGIGTSGFSSGTVHLGAGVGRGIRRPQSNFNNM